MSYLVQNVAICFSQVNCLISSNGAQIVSETPHPINAATYHYKLLKRIIEFLLGINSKAGKVPLYLQKYLADYLSWNNRDDTDSLLVETSERC